MGDVCLLAANLLASSLAGNSVSESVNRNPANTAVLETEKDAAHPATPACQPENHPKLSLKPEWTPPESSPSTSLQASSQSLSQLSLPDEVAPADQSPSELGLVAVQASRQPSAAARSHSASLAPSATAATVNVIGQAITSEPAPLETLSVQPPPPVPGLAPTESLELQLQEPLNQPADRITTDQVTTDQVTTAIALSPITPPEALAPELSPLEKIQPELSQPEAIHPETVQPLGNQASQESWPSLLHQRQLSRSTRARQTAPVTQAVARSEQIPDNWPSLLHQRQQQSNPVRQPLQTLASASRTPQSVVLTQPSLIQSTSTSTQSTSTSTQSTSTQSTSTSTQSTSTQSTSTQFNPFQAAVNQTVLSPEVRWQISGEPIARGPLPAPTLSLPTAPPSPATPSTSAIRPRSGSQMYVQRWAALQAGKLHTRIPTDQFASQWQSATRQPTYQDWKALLAQEARVMAGSQGTNRLTVMLGDSLLMWYPTEQLPRDRFVLNQGISGDTTQGVLQRLSYFDGTRPSDIHVMVGINDLKNGATDHDVLTHLQQIMQQLRSRHSHAHIYVHSLLPTRLAALPSTRIAQLNQQLSIIAQQQAVRYLDLMPYFADADGNLQPSLTTDGLHLNAQGYANWQLAIQNAQQTTQYAQY